MKIAKILFAASLGVALVACSDIDEIAPESGTMLASQVREVNALEPTRAEASFTGMFTNIGKSGKMYSTPDDWEFLMINFCNDLEGADALIPDSGYNWFSVCGEYSSRNASYRNPAIRYRAPYTMIANANDFISGFGDDVTDENSLDMIAQVKVLRAWSYLCLVRSFQFNYQIAKDKPSVPLVTPETVDFTANPRATVGEIYDYILQDLDEAIKTLDATTVQRTTKMYIDANVAHGMRARVYLDMGEWQKAYDDAVAAADGYTPASMAEVSKPSFMSIDEHNWIWGYDMTADVANNYIYAGTSSWLRSFSGYSYSAACQCYTLINSMLWDKIPSSDVRKGWWVDADLKSPLVDNLTWPGLDGNVANASDGGDSKLPFLAYTNVKFGCLTIGTTTNEEDTPLMRVEEMILIQAECLYRLGETKQASTCLDNFVQTYRDPEYSSATCGRDFLDEIWFQRRVELWGEGFYVPDMHRLNKPLVRFHDATTNMPESFRFNMKADDGWFLMRFPQGEMNTNLSIVDNTDGSLPVMDQNPELRDGVTD